MANEKIEILSLLISNREEKFSIRKISQIRNINYKSAYNALKSLEKENLANLQKTGNTTICTFNNNFNDLVFEAEFLRRNGLFKNKDFRVMHNRLAELKFPFIALLFGSQASGTANKHSDIDILTIGGNKEEIQAVLSLLPDKIHLTAISYEEFIHMAKSRKFSVVTEAVKNNIILLGTEEYYRLLKNAG
ncbi:nucleotidyltransferase domain-containing protein [Candidatus Woesearchaeota archaeon]|nr:nucleotidyltransferase domain-containing protein [Candidatus Woesearchaeota archaeon]